MTAARFPQPLAGPRDFAYIAPTGRRLTEYEAVTCYTQPSPHSGGLQAPGDFQLRPDGRAPFDPNGTQLAVGDWYAYRDPGRMWQRPYYSMQSEVEKGIDRVTETATVTGAVHEIAPEWLATGVVGTYLPYAHVEYGLFRALNYAAREALSDTLTTALVFNAADKLRHAQAVTLLGVDLEAALEDFDASRGRRAWLADSAWQPVRALVEDVMALRDWGEVVVAVNLVLEPLLGEPLRRHALLLTAGAGRDVLTPILVSSAMADWQRNSRWAAAFADFVCSADGGPGTATPTGRNRTLLAAWRDMWAERVHAVAAPLFEHLELVMHEPGLAARASGSGKSELDRVGGALATSAERVPA